MQKSTLFLVLALALTLLAPPALAQHGIHQKDFPKVPERPAVTPTDQQKQAAQAFQSAHPEWHLRWNDRSRTPASVLGPPLEVSGATPKQVAQTFLAQNYALFGMLETLSDLKLVRVEKRDRANHAIFQQTHADLPVEGAVYAVHLTKRNKVYYASGTHYDSVRVEQTRPSVPGSQAVEVARQDLGPQLALREAVERELMILPYGGEFRLAWKVILSAREPLGRWIYYVSAADGTVLTGRNDVDTHHDKYVATAQGDVYEHHPQAGPVVSRTLTHLNGSGTELNGTYVRVFNEDDPEAVESDGTFFYSSSDTHFDEVMVYYHATEFQKYLGNQVSYPYLDYPNSIVQVEATVHFGSNLNNAGASFPNTIVFGDGDGFTRNDYAKEDDVIAHEYLHLVTEYITNSGLDHSQGDNNVDFNETGAMDEAFSDYFGATYSDSPKIGEYVKAGPGSLRDLDNSYSASDWDDQSDPIDPGDYHAGGQIFGGALWDLRQQIGQSTADVLIFEGLDNLDQTNPDFLDGRDAILAADQAVYGGQHVSTIKNVFTNRGIAPLQITLSGPTEVTAYTYPSWSAEVVGGEPPYTIKWYDWVYYPNQGPPDQTNGGTQDYYSKQVGDASSDFFLQVLVTDGTTNNDWSTTLAVDVVPGGNTVSLSLHEPLPEAFALQSNAPNPTSGRTTIRYALPEKANVQLVVYDVMGREVAQLANGTQPAGFHEVQFNARDLPSGVYVYHLRAGAFSETKRLVVVK